MRFRVLLLVVALAPYGCRDCVGAKSDAELLPELGTALKNIAPPERWKPELTRFEKKARIYRRPALANRIAKLAQEAEAADQPGGLCTSVQVGQWVLAHLTRLRAELQGQPTTPVGPTLCGTAPRPLIRGFDATWNLYGLGLTAKGLSLVVTSSTSRRDVTHHLEILSPVKARVRLAGADALALGPNDRELSLTSADRELSRVRLTSERPALPVSTTEGRSNLAATATASIPADHILVGGGCRMSSVGTGQVLISSFPGPDGTWRCRAKDDTTARPRSVTAVALSLPSRLGIEPTITSSSSSRAKLAYALANLPAEYLLVGGGCRLIQTSTSSGHVLTTMRPGTRSYECGATDTQGGSTDRLEAYAIGVPDILPYGVVRNTRVDQATDHGHASARLNVDSSVLIGGGCAVQAEEGSHLLWASFPRVDERRWVCAHRDRAPDARATPSAYVLGLRTK